MGGGGKLTPIWLLADDLSPTERAKLDLRVAGRSAPRRKVGNGADVPFGARAQLRLEPDIGLMSCFLVPGGVGLSLGNAFASCGGVLVRPASGSMTVRRGDGRVSVAARQSIFLCGPDPVELELTDVERLDCFAIADDLVTEPMRAASGALRVLRREADSMQVLGSYGAALMRGLMPLNTPRLRDLATRYMADLVAAVCEEPDHTAGGDGFDRPSSRLGAVMSDIEARLSERTLSAGRMAELHGVSVRYLQKLFEAEGLTFSEFVLVRRLEGAMKLLRDTGRHEKSISQIAFDVGFGDLSYFNRTFRRRFGMSPRAARARLEAFASGAPGPAGTDAGGEGACRRMRASRTGPNPSSGGRPAGGRSV